MFLRRSIQWSPGVDGQSGAESKQTRGPAMRSPPRYIEYHRHKNAGALGTKVSGGMSMEQFSSMSLRRLLESREWHLRRSSALLLFSGAVLVPGALLLIIGHGDRTKPKAHRESLRDVGEVVLGFGLVLFAAGIFWLFGSRAIYQKPQSLSSKNKGNDLVSRMLPKPSVTLWREGCSSDETTGEVRGMPLNVSSISIRIDSAKIVPNSWQRVYDRCPNVQRALRRANSEQPTRARYTRQTSSFGHEPRNFLSHAETIERRRRRSSIDNSDILASRPVTKDKDLCEVQFLPEWVIPSTANDPGIVSEIQSSDKLSQLVARHRLRRKSYAGRGCRYGGVVSEEGCGESSEEPAIMDTGCADNTIDSVKASILLTPMNNHLPSSDTNITSTDTNVALTITDVSLVDNNAELNDCTPDSMLPNVQATPSNHNGNSSLVNDVMGPIKSDASPVHTDSTQMESVGTDTIGNMEATIVNNNVEWNSANYWTSSSSDNVRVHGTTTILDNATSSSIKINTQVDDSILDNNVIERSVPVFYCSSV